MWAFQAGKLLLFHVGHDPRVARDIDTVPFAADDEPRLRTHVFTVSVFKNTGGVGGKDQWNFDIAAYYRATHVEPITLNRAFIDQMLNQLVHPSDRSVQFLWKVRHIGQMVKVPMGKKDVCGPFESRVMFALWQHRVSSKPRVNQQDLIFDLDEHARVAQPGDVHGEVLFSAWVVSMCSKYEGG